MDVIISVEVVSSVDVASVAGVVCMDTNLSVEVVSSANVNINVDVVWSVDVLAVVVVFLVVDEVFSRVHKIENLS